MKKTLIPIFRDDEKYSKAEQEIKSALSGLWKIDTVLKMLDDFSHNVRHVYRVTDYDKNAVGPAWRKCSWTQANVIGRVCPGSIHIKLKLGSSPKFSVQEIYVTPITHNAKMVAVTFSKLILMVSELAKRAVGSHNCRETDGQKPTVILLSYHYAKPGRDLSGHANILFLENQEMIRYDPARSSASVDKLDSINDILSRLASKCALEYRIVGDDYNIPRGMSLQRRSKGTTSRRPEERGTCAMWVILITVIKCQRQCVVIENIVEKLSQLSNDALYCLITAVTAYFVLRCSAKKE